MAPRKTLAMVQTGPRALEPRDLPVPEIGDDGALLPGRDLVSDRR